MTTHENDRRDESEQGRRPFGPALALCALWLGLLAWQGLEHDADVRRARGALEERGEASVRILEASIRSMGRGRRQRVEFVEAILEEATKVPGVRGIWLATLAGDVVASAGGDRDLPALARGGANWSEEDILVGRVADLADCLMEGRGPPQASIARDAPMALYVSLDRAPVDREIAAHLRLRVVVQAVAGLAGLGAFLLIRGRRRTRTLRTELAVARERERIHRQQAALGAGLAHETKNPLSVVRGIAERLAEGGCGGAGCAERARDIVDEVDRVVARINEFLHYSRPLEPKPEPVAVRPLLDAMARLIAPDLEPHGGRVAIEAPDVTVRADHSMLRQILLNLLVNAARHGRADGTIRLSARPEADGTLTLEVADDGPGVPQGERERIFEPYYTRSPGGTGLGLAIVRRLAELNGWTVAVSGESGRGAEFRVRGLEP